MSFPSLLTLPGTHQQNSLPKLEIRNIKISIILKSKTNFFGIFEIDKAIVTIYENTRHLINVTKLKGKQEIHDITLLISEYFNFESDNIECVRIDSIMLSRKVKDRKFSMKRMLKVCHIFKDKGIIHQRKERYQLVN